jgi:hypothetical protein
MLNGKVLGSEITNNFQTSSFTQNVEIILQVFPFYLEKEEIALQGDIDHLTWINSCLFSNSLSICTWTYINVQTLHSKKIGTSKAMISCTNN